jgi:hypothetical protein
MKGDLFMKTISLNRWGSNPVTISDEGYDALLKLIEQYRVCGKCHLPYAAQNPEVAENVCLICVIQRHEELTFVGALGEKDSSGNQQFQFIDERGYIYRSNSGYPDDPKEDTFQTLVYWGFPVPTAYTPPRCEEVTLHPHSWRIYGDVKTASVVVIEKTYDQKHEVAFLSYKGGEFRELTKREAQMKSLLLEARAIIELSKGEDEWYYVPGFEAGYVSDLMLYTIVSRLASAAYDVKSRLQKEVAAAKKAAGSQVTAI